LFSINPPDKIEKGGWETGGREQAPPAEVGLTPRKYRRPITDYNNLLNLIQEKEQIQKEMAIAEDQINRLKSAVQSDKEQAEMFLQMMQESKQEESYLKNELKRKGNPSDTVFNKRQKPAST
jgi:hypothetical protein